MALVFLDVDGTLLPFGSPSGSPAGTESLLAGIDPRHGPRLAALACELVWATTWMNEANETIAPLLGLPRLKVLDALEPAFEDDYFTLHWKTRAIVGRAAGRAFAWVDDEITDSDRQWIEDRHPAPVLVLRVDPRRGLTVPDVDALERWLGENSGAVSPDASAGTSEVVTGRESG